MASDNRLLQQSTVYAFHVPSMNAIKVGFGSDGRTRMSHYSRQYGLVSSAVSLREWRLPSPSLASSIETACHRALLEAGFCRVSHVVDEQEARELFDCGHHSYEQAVLVVAEAIEETISSLYEALGKFKPLSQEKARQQKESAQQSRNAIREEKKKKTEEEEIRLISAATIEIKHRWSLDVEPYLIACSSAKTIYSQFNHSQGLLASFFTGNKNAAVRMKNWNQFPLIKRSIREIFHTARRTKALCCEMNKKYGYSAGRAAINLGFPMGGLNNWDLPMVGSYSDENGIPYLEVRLVVQKATGFGGDDAIELMAADTEIMALVQYAAQNLPPELKRI